MTSFGSDCIRALMAQGYDTQEIAKRVGCNEAHIWNLLARGSDQARPTLRLAGATGSPPTTAPVASAIGVPFPVVVRDMGRKAEGVDEIKLTGNVLRQACRLVVHRDVSGGIGKPQ